MGRSGLTAVLVGVVLVSATGAVAAPPPLAEPFPDAVRARVEGAVVIAETFGADGAHLGSVSAFIAGPGWLITNWHCVEGASEIVLNLGDRGTFRVDGILAEDREHDVVLLAVDLPEGLVTPLPLAESRAGRGTPVAAIVRDDAGVIRVSEGRTGREVTSDGASSLPTTAPGWLGCSGSPVVDHNGVVVGVANRFVDHEEDELLAAAPAWHVAAMKTGPVVPIWEWWAALETPGGPASRLARRTGDWHFTQGDFAEALREYERAVEFVPTDRQAVLSLAMSLEGSGRVGEATATIQTYLSLAPDDAKAWRALGHVHLRAKSYSEAVVAYRSSARLRPTAETYYWLGSAYFYGGAMVDATEAFEKSLELDTEHADSLEALESQYGHAARHEEVCEVHLRRIAAAAAEPEDSDQIAAWLVQEGRIDLAQKIGAAVGGQNHYVANRIAARVRTWEAAGASDSKSGEVGVRPDAGEAAAPATQTP